MSNREGRKYQEKKKKIPQKREPRVRSHHG